MFEVKFTVSGPVAIGEENDYTVSIDARIMPLDEDCSAYGKIIGRARARLILVDQACRDGASMFDVFDCVDQDQHEVYGAVIDPASSRVRDDLCANTDRTDVLFVESVELLPKYRGWGLGLLTIRKLMDVFGGSAAVTVLEPAPVDYTEAGVVKGERPHWAKKMKADRFGKSLGEAQESLKSHWAKLGFEPIPGTDGALHFLDMSAAPVRLPEEDVDYLWSLAVRLFPDDYEREDTTHPLVVARAEAKRQASLRQGDVKAATPKPSRG